jgi:hypothetical protein
MIKFRIIPVGRVDCKDWDHAFDSYEEAIEYGDFLVDCRLILGNEKADEGYVMKAKDRRRYYFIVAEEEEDGRCSA